MAQLWTTGPAHCFVGPFNCQPSAANYLGTAVRKPKISKRKYEEEAYADQGGNKVAFDTSDQGEDALIEYNFTRFNWLTYQAISNVPNVSSAIAGTPTAEPGTYLPGDIGTFGMTEEQGITVFVLFPYAAKPFYGAGTTMPAGYRFPNCKIVLDVLEGLGPDALVIPLAWHARRIFDPTANPNAYGVGTFTLYDFNVSGLSVATN
jgi:hypothetical protein